MSDDADFIRGWAGGLLILVVAIIAAGVFLSPWLLFALAVPAVPLAAGTAVMWGDRRDARKNVPPPPAISIAACPSCGGKWGRWSKPQSDRYGSHSGQTRECEECGYLQGRQM